MGASTHPVTFHTHVTFEPRKAIVALKNWERTPQMVEGQEVKQRVLENMSKKVSGAGGQQGGQEERE